MQQLPLQTSVVNMSQRHSFDCLTSDCLQFLISFIVSQIRVAGFNFRVGFMSSLLLVFSYRCNFVIASYTASYVQLMAYFTMLCQILNA